MTKQHWLYHMGSNENLKFWEQNWRAKVEGQYMQKCQKCQNDAKVEVYITITAPSKMYLDISQKIDKII